MRKMIIFTICACCMAGLTLSVPAQNKTIENLKIAFKGEITASAKYAAYTEKAKTEGFIQIAYLFEAAAKSESIHAANHKTVLGKMGQSVDDINPEFKVKTTRENLEDAIVGEAFEFNDMYPEYIEIAKSENAADAVKSFRWAMETEKRHNDMYKKALVALNNNNVKSLSSVYFVCPKCGNMYDTSKPEKNCSFCYTSNSKFIKFGK